MGMSWGMIVRLDEGWEDRHISTPSKTPASNNLIFPPPPSSAGVPMTTRRPGRFFMLAWTPSPAPKPAMAIRLWPQPWPISGKASYSARTATVGPSPAPPSRVARNAVSTPPMPRSTAKSWASSVSDRSLAA